MRVRKSIDCQCNMFKQRLDGNKYLFIAVENNMTAWGARQVVVKLLQKLLDFVKSNGLPQPNSDNHRVMYLEKDYWLGVLSRYQEENQK